MRLPDFFIVGAAKSGTTSLWQYLQEHPDIFMTNDIQFKELCFYCNSYGIKDEKEYSSYFNLASEKQLIGEACHAYLSSPESAELIKKNRPDAKIIIVLRNPINRAYSLYNWMTSEGYEWINTFEGALIEENKRIIDSNFVHNSPQGYYNNYLYFNSGLYYEQIKKYYDTFNPDSCLILLYEDLTSDPLKEVKKIFTFLGVREDFQPKLKIHNKGKNTFSPALQYFLRFNFFNLILKYPFKKSFLLKVRDKLMEINASKTNTPLIDPNISKSLKEKYRENIYKTQDLIKKDLSIWLN